MLERTRRLWSRLAGTDRRHSDRAESGGTSICQASAKDLARTDVRVHDVSRTGLSFLIDRPLAPGALVTLENSGVGTSSAVLACVRHSTPDPAGGFVIGCTFAIELAEAALAGLGVSRQAPPTGDKRRWVRAAPTGDRAVVKQLTDPEAGPVLMRVFNLSPTGVGLLAEHRVEPGTLLDVELLGRGEAPGLAVLAVVIFSSERDGGEWLVGCAFIRELTDTELKSWT
jgi:hypothetical protein